MLVRAHCSWARRARRKASATSSAVDCGIIPIGWPLNGQYVGTLSPLVAISRSVSLRTKDGSSAYDADGSVEGSRRSVLTWPGICGSWSALIYREYVTAVSGTSPRLRVGRGPAGTRRRSLRCRGHQRCLTVTSRYD